MRFDVGKDFQAEQVSLDGHFIGGKWGAASGLGDLTREQVKAMRMRERKQFAGAVLVIGTFMFLATYVFLDVSHLGDLINLPL